MKKLTESLAAKIAAIILSFFTAAVFGLSVLSVCIMAAGDFYVTPRETVKINMLENLAENRAWELGGEYESDIDFSYYKNHQNIYFVITDSETGEVIYNNYKNEPYITSYTAANYAVSGQEVYTDEYGNEDVHYITKQKINITVYVAEDMKYNDIFSLAVKFTDTMYSLKYTVFLIGAAAFILTVVLLIYLCCAAGHRKDGGIKLNHLDKMPFDLMLTAAIILESMGAVLVTDSYGWWRLPVIAVFASVTYFVVLAVTMTFAARIKTGTLVSNNIIYKLLRFVGRGLKKGWNALKYLFKNLSLIGKTVLITAGVIFLELIFFSACYYSPSMLLFWWFVFTAAIALTVLFTAVILQKIKRGGERIALGDLEFKIDTQYMYGDFKRFAESLNNINLGLQSAVNEKMKSERFRTELITNVSHDIKTPLTSIINYVDLIKKEELESETVRQYIEVLDRQSGRLKKLIEDLVEASKASTGNLAVNLAECEVGVLLSQTIGEFDERLANSGLTAVLKQPETPVRIMADGRHLWRVFDNLMSNICKYSQPETRVYMDVCEKNKKAVITFRNISKYELNISGEELMERFVRGDSSRNTEGSGLGLSIAESLVELQNGQMNIDVDGDLFKVTLIFDAV